MQSWDDVTTDVIVTRRDGMPFTYDGVERREFHMMYHDDSETERRIEDFMEGAHEYASPEDPPDLGPVPACAVEEVAVVN